MGPPPILISRVPHNSRKKIKQENPLNSKRGANHVNIRKKSHDGKEEEWDAPDVPILEPTLTLQSLFSLLKKARNPPDKNKDFPLCQTLTILGKRAKTHKKARRTAKRKKKRGKRKKTRIGGSGT